MQQKEIEKEKKVKEDRKRVAKGIQTEMRIKRFSTVTEWKNEKQTSKNCIETGLTFSHQLILW